MHTAARLLCGCLLARLLRTGCIADAALTPFLEQIDGVEESVTKVSHATRSYCSCARWLRGSGCLAGLLLRRPTTAVLLQQSYHSGPTAAVYAGCVVLAAWPGCCCAVALAG